MKKMVCGMLAFVCFTTFATANISADKVSATPKVKTEASEIIKNALSDNSSDTDNTSTDSNGIGAYAPVDNSETEEYTFKTMLDKYLEETTTPMYEKVLNYAKTFIGIPYVYGGSSPSGFDCSGFVKYVLGNFGIEMPRTSYSQMSVGEPVDISDIQPGDILFFRGGGHVGFYVGDGQYLHSPRTGRTVSIDPLTRDIYCARRIF